MSRLVMWLSFADAGLPKGKQFLGGGLFKGDGVVSATVEAHRLKMNPGGQVLGWGPLRVDKLSDAWRSKVGKLMNRAEIDDLNIDNLAVALEPKS